MSSKPTGNQFGQIVTCVAAARVMALRFGATVDFGSLESHYNDDLTRQRIIEGSETLFDAQWSGDQKLVYLGNVFGSDHMGGGVVVSENEAIDITFKPVASPKMAGRVQHMSARMAVRRVQGEMARFGKRMGSRAFSKVDIPVTMVSESMMHVGINFDDKVETGFLIETSSPADAKECLQYANETMKKLADCITGMWPAIIPHYIESQPTEGDMDEFSEVKELRKANPIWGTW